MEPLVEKSMLSDVIADAIDNNHMVQEFSAQNGVERGKQNGVSIS
jgi:hypothetical protein